MPAEENISIVCIISASLSMVKYCIFTYKYIDNTKGPFINYLRVPREGGGKTHSYVIFSKSILNIRNRGVKWFGRGRVSFASGR